MGDKFEADRLRVARMRKKLFRDNPRRLRPKDYPILVSRISPKVRPENWSDVRDELFDEMQAARYLNNCR
jgi:hypothetical protein